MTFRKSELGFCNNVIERLERGLQAKLVVIEVCTETEKRVQMLLLSLRSWLVVERQNLSESKRDLGARGNLQTVQLTAKKRNRSGRSELAFSKCHAKADIVQNPHNGVKIRRALVSGVANDDQVVEIYRGDDEYDGGTKNQFHCPLKKIPSASETLNTFAPLNSTARTNGNRKPPVIRMDLQVVVSMLEVNLGAKFKRSYEMKNLGDLWHWIYRNTHALLLN